MVEPVKYNDYPIQDCLNQAQEILAKGNATIHQKWTCRHCGSRQTMEEPNKFFASGRCEECGQITVISKCNYMIHFQGVMK